MAILLIEYRVADFGGWKDVFDQDPMGRRRHGVTSHWIFQDSDDPNHFMLSMEFSSEEEARTFRKVLEPVLEVSGAERDWVLQDPEPATL